MPCATHVLKGSESGRSPAPHCMSCLPMAAGHLRMQTDTHAGMLLSRVYTHDWTSCCQIEPLLINTTLLRCHADSWDAGLTMFVIQVVLNWLWTPIFFQLHWLGWASLEIVGECTCTSAP